MNAGAGHTLYLARRYDEAIAACEKSLEESTPTSSSARMSSACAGRCGSIHREAIELAEQAAAMCGPGAVLCRGAGPLSCARRCDRHGDGQILTELDAISGNPRYVPPHCWTFIHAGLNKMRTVWFEWQAKAQEDGASPFYVSPLIDNLQADPRHLEQMRRMGWPI